ncbi:MAG: acetoacetate decarboxylase family protein [Desulfosalsimonadaceae bacterium]|nr:acetoacetate decarboxylase family protein [Desulfosalsimonadaceae bacterium]
MQPVALKRETFFKGIMQRTIPEYDVKLPIFYYDTTSMTAIYTASTARIRAYLPSDILHPVELYPGRCLAVLSAFEYRKTDIGPYNEFSLATLVSCGKRGLPGLTLADQMLRNEMHLFILSLPVDSEVARRGAVELSGYPKFLADFSWSADDRSLACEVSVGGKPLIRMRGQKLPTSQGRMLHSVVYTQFQNCLLKANLYIDPLEFAQSFSRKNVSIEIGDGHELCHLLKDLRMGGQPLGYQFSPLSRAILFDAKNIIDR